MGCVQYGLLKQGRYWMQPGHHYNKQTWRLMHINQSQLLRASCLMLENKEFRCYEAKIEESEKGNSRQESNPGHLWQLKPEVSWAQLPAAVAFFTFLYFHLNSIIQIQLASETGTCT